MSPVQIMGRKSINSDAAFAATSTGRMGRISGTANVQSQTVSAESPAFRSVSCVFGPTHISAITYNPPAAAEDLPNFQSLTSAEIVPQLYNA